MSWTTAITELRSVLNDTEASKFRFRKKVYGRIDGVNATFKTFEFRRITDFSTEIQPKLGIFVDGVRLLNTAVNADNPDTGDFILNVAPLVTVKQIEASYYSEWFLDTELSTYLGSAGRWAAFPDYTVAPPGLQSAILQYAGSEAYKMLALKFAELESEQYRAEDSENPRTKPASERYAAMAQTMFKQAMTEVKFFYDKRQGQSDQASFATVRGRVRNVTGKR